MRLLTIALVAQVLCLSPVTVAHWAYGRRAAPDGFPPPLKIARRLRWREEDISHWLESLATDAGATLSAPSSSLTTLGAAATCSASKQMRPGRPRKSAGRA
jgi:predicted DNA-binding transcriptional regulator AlpA